VLRRSLLAAARNDKLRRFTAESALTRPVVSRFVAGRGLDEAVNSVTELKGQGLLASLDHLGEDTLDAAQASAARGAYLELLERLAAEGLVRFAEVSVKLSALGLRLDEAMALGNVRAICARAAQLGTTVTLDMEDSGTTDATLRIHAQLRSEFPETGAVLQAYLHRTEADCRALAGTGSRVRLCKGAYAEPATVAYQGRRDVDAAYGRCLTLLMDGSCYPMVATHDPKLVALARRLARERGKGPEEFEFQMLYGIRHDEQLRLARDGYRVRVYVPYGDQWYGYLVRRLAERPANLIFFLRALSGGWRVRRLAGPAVNRR
jgi:proline dehydrogenase